jgi:GntR family transcriptional regulator
VSIDPYAATPLYQQLADLLRAQIARGALPAGRAIPGTGVLAETHRVSRGTVRKAVELLKEEGLLVAVVGRGTFVRRGS